MLTKERSHKRYIVGLKTRLKMAKNTVIELSSSLPKVTSLKTIESTSTTCRSSLSKSLIKKRISSVT